MKPSRGSKTHPVEPAGKENRQQQPDLPRRDGAPQPPQLLHGGRLLANDDARPIRALRLLRRGEQEAERRGGGLQAHEDKDGYVGDFAGRGVGGVEAEVDGAADELFN